MTSNVPLRRLEELYLNELYNELCGELYNVVLKAAYDSIRLLNDLTEEKELELSNRLASGDVAYLHNINPCKVGGYCNL